MGISDLIDMTAGGVIAGAPPQPSVMPSASVVNTPPPAVFVPPPPVVAPPPAPKKPRAKKAPATPAPVLAQIPVPVAPPSAPAMPYVPIPLSQQFPHPDATTRGMSVVDNGQVIYTPVVNTPPTQQVQQPVQAAVVAPPVAVNADPMHNQIFGSFPMSTTPQQVSTPGNLASLADFDPDADIDWDQVEPDEEDLSPLVAVPASVMSGKSDALYMKVDQIVQMVTAGVVATETAKEDALAFGTHTGNQVQFPHTEPISIVVGNDTDINRSKTVIDQMDKEIWATQFALGIALLTNPDHYDKKNPAHEAIWFARWNPGGIMSLSVDKILSMGVSLSLHQVWVAGEENKWTARAAAVKEQIDELILLKRDSAAGSTKQEKEINCVRNDPYMGELDRHYTKAKYMAAMLLGMADRFAQLENSLKRPADRRAAEQSRSENTREWTRTA